MAGSRERAPVGRVAPRNPAAIRLRNRLGGEKWQRRLPATSSCRCRRGGQSVAADRPGARSARPQHHGILQGVQRAHRADGEGHADSGRHHRLSGPSFTFETKTPPVTFFLKKAAGIGKNLRLQDAGPRLRRQGDKAQVREIAEKKMKPDLNANDVEAAMAMIEGSARSMGLEVVG
jgi:hypothetical protein